MRLCKRIEYHCCIAPKTPARRARQYMGPVTISRVIHLRGGHRRGDVITLDLLYPPKRGRYICHVEAVVSSMLASAALDIGRSISNNSFSCYYLTGTLGQWGT